MFRRRFAVIIATVVVYNFTAWNSGATQQGKLLKVAHYDRSYTIILTITSDGYVIATDTTNTSIQFKAETITHLNVGPSSQLRNALQNILGVNDTDTLRDLSEKFYSEIRDYLEKENLRERVEEAELAADIPIARITLKPFAEVLARHPGERPPTDSLKVGVPAILSHGPKGPVPGLWSKSTYYKIEKEEKHVKIKQVQIAFEGGLIKDMLVDALLVTRKTAKGSSGTDTTITDTTSIVFRNRHLVGVSNPRQIEKVNEEGNNVLFGKKGEYAIDLANLIDYKRIVLKGSASYEPKDRVITLNPETARNVTLVKKSLFDNLDLRIYSDLEGLSADEPNGLLQVEARYNVLWNSGWMFKLLPGGAYTLIPFNQVSTFINASKIEELVTELPIDSTQGLKSTALDFYRFSTLSVGVDLNLLAIIEAEWKGFLDFGFGVYRTTVTDSTGGDNDIISRYIKLAATVWRIEGNRIDYNLAYRWIRFVSNDRGIVFTDGKELQQFQLNFNVHPNPKDQDKSIFLRYTFSFTGDRSDDLSLQVGYATPISKILGGRD